MHAGNIEWLKELDVRYRAELAGAALLELGSLNVNGTARDYLQVGAWIGVDQEAGLDVDIVSPANRTMFWPGCFDIILCTSMLEHDPAWRDSLSHNLLWLKSGGLLLLSWGAEGNTHHLPEPWALVPLADVEAWAASVGLATLESYWERDRHTGDGAGVYDMVLRKPV